MAQIDGDVQGLLPGRREPGGRLGQRARCSGSGMANLDWLVVRDFSLIETRHVLEGRPGDRDRRAAHRGHRHRGVLPARPPRTPRRTARFTNTQRLLQWHHKAVEPAGDARSDLWFIYHLGRSIREKLAGSTDERDRPLLDLTWDYPTTGRSTSPSAEAVLRRDQRLRRRTAKPLSATPQLKDDGSTACGCWIYCGVLRRRRQPGRPAQARQRSRTGSAPEWGWAWPANRRILYNRASADPDGRPWSERKALRLVGRRSRAVDRARRARLHRRQAPRLPAARGRDAAPDALARHRPVHHAGRRQGLAVRARRAGRRAAARRTTSRRSRRSRNPLYGQQRNPARQLIGRARTTGTTRPATSPAPTSSRTCSPPTG